MQCFPAPSHDCTVGKVAMSLPSVQATQLLSPSAVR